MPTPTEASAPQPDMSAHAESAQANTINEAIAAAQNAVELGRESNKDVLSPANYASGALEGRGVHLAPEGSLTVDVDRHDTKAPAAAAHGVFYTPKSEITSAAGSKAERGSTLLNPTPRTRGVHVSLTAPGDDRTHRETFIETRRGEHAVRKYSGAQAERLAAVAVKHFAKKIENAADDVPRAAPNNQKPLDGMHLYS